MLIIKEELLSIMIEEYPNWLTTPENFLNFILLMDQLSELDAEVYGTDRSARDEFAEDLAALLIRELHIDLLPYRDFRDLKTNGPVQDDQMQMLERISQKMKEDDRVFDLTLETGIMPSEETMLTDIAKDFFARYVIERLRPYVDFR
nr:hypothetical protein [Mucilaginibacter sp. L294]